MQLHDLCVSFDNRAIFAKYNAEFGDRNLIVLWGDNGTGKTTLMKVLSGLILPASGVIINSPASVCYVPTNISEFILPWYTIQKNIIYFSRYKYSSDQSIKAFDEFLLPFKVDWQAKDLCTTRACFLSAGQKTLLAMFCIELVNPAVILFDETFSNLNHNLHKSIHNWIKTLIDDEKKLFICSHDYFFCRKISKEVFEIKAAKYLPIKEILSK